MKATKKSIVQNSIKIEDDEYVLNCIYDNISKADNKISILFGIFSIAFTVINPFSLIGSLNTTCNFLKIMCYIIFLLIIILFVLGSGILIFALCPRLSGKESNKNYSIFFADISDLDNEDEYVNLSNNEDRKAFAYSLKKQIYNNSNICTKKMNLFQTGLIICSIDIFLLIILELLITFILFGCFIILIIKINEAH